MGIDPETLRLAAQCLNHYATPGPSCRVLVVYQTTLHNKCSKDALTAAHCQTSRGDCALSDINKDVVGEELLNFGWS